MVKCASKNVMAIMAHWKKRSRQSALSQGSQVLRHAKTGITRTLASGVGSPP